MRSRGQAPVHAGPSRGLTLLELLVTLLIVSFVVAILSQALSQLARIERLLEGGQLRSAAVALRAEWVRGALAGLLPGAGQTEHFSGSERELTGVSTEVPQWPAPGLARLHLRLRADDRNGVMVLEQLPEAGGGGEPVVLLQWPGREGRFMYLDTQDRWVDRWPLVSADAVPALPRAASPLPRALALDTGPGGPGFLLAVPLARSTGAPTRALLESM